MSISLLSKGTRTLKSVSVFEMLMCEDYFVFELRIIIPVDESI